MELLFISACTTSLVVFRLGCCHIAAVALITASQTRVIRIMDLNWIELSRSVAAHSNFYSRQNSKKNPKCLLLIIIWSWLKYAALRISCAFKQYQIKLIWFGPECYNVFRTIVGHNDNENILAYTYCKYSLGLSILNIEYRTVQYSTVHPFVS